MSDQKITPTPRRLSLALDIDVTEGPRLRRGTREAELREQFKPLVRYIKEYVEKETGLKPGSIDFRIQWGYVWFDTKDKIAWERDPED